ncbi:ATP-binding protein [Streptomyces monashensis]|uniref:ATP-binding protein n=1 Tax=Streptomyces monashensis TaxID=1678012 RepID=UPI0033DEA5E0
MTDRNPERDTSRDAEGAAAAVGADGTAADERPQGVPGATGERAGRRIDIAGDAGGPVVAGDHNVVIDAQHGSTVTLLMEGQRPRPVRRGRVALLPRRQPVPLGRDTELERLADALRDGGPVQVWGALGVGKSTLLRHAARTLVPERDGVLFLDAARREPEDLAQDMFEACYEARGYAPSSPELRRLMTGLHLTVYVDNAEFPAEGLRTLMDAAPDATFVVAGRDRSLLGDGTALRLDGIDRAPALELLARELGRPVAAGAEQHTAAELWETAAGLPLLLLRAAALARLASSGPAVLPRPGAVGELLPALLGRLGDPALRILRLLTTLDDAELDADHIDALSGAPDTPAQCGRLVDLGLAERTERGYRAVPDVVPVLRERHPEPFSVEALCDHFATWIGRRATTAAQVERHARALEVVAELAEAAGRPELAVRIVRAASPALARSLRFGVWGRLLDRGLPAARRVGDQQAVAYFTHEQGIRNLLTGRRVLAAVLLTEAAVLWRQIGDLHGANAAAGAQQYVPPHVAGTPGTPGTVPHTDGGAQSLGSSGTGPDPASAHGAATHGATAHGGGTSAAPGAGTQHPAVAQHSAASPHAASPHAAPPHAAAPHAAGAHMSGAKVGAAKAGAAAHSAGAAHVGASATTGAAGTGATGAGVSAAAVSTAGASAAAGSTAGFAALLKVIAVIVAVVIGGVAVHQRLSGDSTPGSSRTGLAGTWQGSDGGMYTFVQAGAGSYTVSGTDGCGQTSTTEYTGGNGSYSTTRPLYDVSSGSCGSAIGQVRTTITLDAGGETARATTEMTSSSDQAQCYSCGTITLTRRP